MPSEIVAATPEGLTMVRMLSSTENFPFWSFSSALFSKTSR